MKRDETLGKGFASEGYMCASAKLHPLENDHDEQHPVPGVQAFTIFGKDDGRRTRVQFECGMPKAAKGQRWGEKAEQSLSGATRAYRAKKRDDRLRETSSCAGDTRGRRAPAIRCGALAPCVWCATGARRRAGEGAGPTTVDLPH